MHSSTFETDLSVASETEPEDEDIVVAVHHVRKNYKLWTSPSVRLRYSLLSKVHRSLRKVVSPGFVPLQTIQRWRDGLCQDFTALHDVSFEVRRGESLGILGRNGAGKSTLLQIIAGTLPPSAGHVNVYGRVAALLELGSGFNGEYTGRENVYLNAAILGFSKAEVDAKFDGIAAFADIGRFLEQPVKTYSSGMMLRLAFAVQMAIDPGLFIIDEALAVGDIYFQSKCNKLLKQKLADGMTLLLVSHDPGAVRSLCTRAVVLDQGKMAFVGPSDEATSVYHAIHSGALAGKSLASAVASLIVPGVAEPDDAGTADGNPEPFTGIGSEDIISPELALEQAAAVIPQKIAQFQDEIGDGTLALTGCGLFDAEGLPTRSFTAGESIRVGITFVPRQDFLATQLIAGFQIRDRFNNVVSAGTSLNGGIELPDARAGKRYVLLLRLSGRLGTGKYLLDFGLGSDADHAGSPLHYHHRIGGIAAFQVEWFGREVTFQGICDLSARFSSTQLAGTS